MINKDVNHNYYHYTDRLDKNNDSNHDYAESNIHGIHGINKLVADRQARCNSVVYHELVHSSLRGLD